MVIRRSFPVGRLAMNTSLFMCESTRNAAIVDPGDEADKLAQTAQEMGATVEWLILTHGHMDHMGATAALKRLWPTAKVALHREELPMYEAAPQLGHFFGMPVEAGPPPDRFLADGEEVTVGRAKLRVLFTPGHTAGGISLWHPEPMDGAPEGMVFVGDALFRGSIGRTDLPGGDYDQLVAGIREKILTLPRNAVVVPGHGPETTVALEADTNPFVGTGFGADVKGVNGEGKPTGRKRWV